jgi:hypothetical protein
MHIYACICKTNAQYTIVTIMQALWQCAFLWLLCIIMLNMPTCTDACEACYGLKVK